MDKPLDRQVGGDHYKRDKLQPLEITYQKFGYDGVKASLFTKVTKYLTRDKDDEALNLHKALHCVDMLIQFQERENDRDTNSGDGSTNLATTRSDSYMPDYGTPGQIRTIGGGHNTISQRAGGTDQVRAESGGRSPASSDPVSYGRNR